MNHLILHLILCKIEHLNESKKKLIRENTKVVNKNALTK